MNRQNRNLTSVLRHHAFLVTGLAVSALLVVPPLLSKSNPAGKSVESAAVGSGTTLASIDSDAPLLTRPIEQIEVGDRVMALLTGGGKQ